MVEQEVRQGYIDYAQHHQHQFIIIDEQLSQEILIPSVVRDVVCRIFVCGRQQKGQLNIMRIILLWGELFKACAPTDHRGNPCSQQAEISSI